MKLIKGLEMYALILNQEGHLRVYFLHRMVVLATAFLPNLPFTYSILTLSPKMGLSNPNECGGNFTVFCPSITRIRAFISVAHYFLAKSLKQVQITALSITI
jgi:hypothetical protein